MPRTATLRRFAQALYAIAATQPRAARLPITVPDIGMGGRD